MCIYFACLRSLLEFGCVIWSANNNFLTARIESVQKKFVIFALRKVFPRTDNLYLPPYSERFYYLSIQSLSSRNEQKGLVFVFDVLNKKK